MGSVSGPLVEDKLLGRLVVSYKDADGWRDNPNIDEKVDVDEDFSIEHKFRSSLDLAYMYTII